MRKIIFRLQLLSLAGALIYQTFSQKTFHEKVLSQLNLSETKYRLPFKAHSKHFMIQGSKTLLTHRGYYTHAWDFIMLPGTEILAARAGTVVKIVDNKGFIDGGFHGNLIVIEHDDGTKAEYSHIRKGSSRFMHGQLVKQGEVIAVSGMTLYTLYPHLHFNVMSADNSSTIPAVFEDAKYIQQMGFYTSKNTVPPINTSSIH